jgi:hypothetical protein
MAFDTSGTLEFRASPARMLGLALIGLALTGVSAVLAFRLFESISAGSFAEFIGMVGMALFGAATLYALWQASRGSRVVVTISPDGIRDTRLATQFIPWTGISSISTWKPATPGSASKLADPRVVVLAVDPQVEAGLTLSRMARWTRNANRSLGADGLSVTSAGLATSHDELLAAAQAFWQAARNADAEPGPVERLFKEVADQALDESLPRVVAAIRSHRFLLPLAAPPEADGSMQLLTSKDNRDLMWACLYADQATAGRILTAGTTVLHATLADTLKMVRTMESTGGIALYAGESFYMLPIELAGEVERLLGAGQPAPAG